MLGKKKENESEKLPLWLSEHNDKEFEVEDQKVASTTAEKEEGAPLLKSNDKKSYTEPRNTKEKKTKMGKDDNSKKMEEPVKESGKIESQELHEEGGGEEGDDDHCSFTLFCNNTFTFISTVVVVSHLCMVVAQILPIILIDVDFLEVVLRVYITIFTFTCIGIEMEYVLKNTIASNFMVRGIIYSFIGLVGMEQSIAIRVDMLHLDHVASTWAQFASLFLHISSWIETVIGYLYFVMGFFCMRQMRDQMREKAKEIKKELREKREAKKARQ